MRQRVPTNFQHTDVMIQSSQRPLATRVTNSAAPFTPRAVLCLEGLAGHDRVRRAQPTVDRKVHAVHLKSRSKVIFGREGAGGKRVFERRGAAVRGASRGRWKGRRLARGGRGRRSAVEAGDEQGTHVGRLVCGWRGIGETCGCQLSSFQANSSLSLGTSSRGRRAD